MLRYLLIYYKISSHLHFFLKRKTYFCCNLEHSNQVYFKSVIVLKFQHQTRSKIIVLKPIICIVLVAMKMNHKPSLFVLSFLFFLPLLLLIGEIKSNIVQKVILFDSSLNMCFFYLVWFVIVY